MVLTILIFATVSGAVFCLFVLSRRLVRSQTRGLLIVTALAGLVFVFHLYLRPGFWLASGILVIIAAVIVGAWIGRVLLSVQSVIVFCVIASIIDVISFYFGVAARLQETFRTGASDLLTYFSITIPHGGNLQPVIGMGDLIVSAVLYYALLRLGLTGGWVFSAPLAGLWIALVLELVFTDLFAVPFIAGVTIIYLVVEQNRRNTHARAGSGRRS